MSESEHFTIDPEAHAAAKASGDYGTEDPDAPKTEEETPEDGEKKDDEFVAPEHDPADDEQEAEGDDEEEKEEEEEAEKKAPETTEFATLADGWTNEFMEKGELSEESQTAVLESVFKDEVPEEMRQEYMKTFTAGLGALRTAAANEQFAMVGGVEQYQQMLAWGADNLSTEEIASFDKAALSTELDDRSAAIKGLHARMQLATGGGQDFEPDLSHTAERQGGEPLIASRQELMLIQRSEKYKTDAAYREKVGRQLKQSMDTGNYDA
jgi:hypothetical protein